MAIDPLSAVATAGVGLLGGISSIYNNERNLNFQNEAQNYNKYAQQVTWQREDNAVQRRVADLKAAGLSPVLAAGSSAQAGSPTKIDPVNSSDALGAEGFMSGTTKAAQTQQSLMAAEAAKSVVNMNNANIGKIAADEALSASKAAAINKEWGLKPGSSMVLHPKFNDPWGKRVTEAKDLIKDTWGASKKKVNDAAQAAEKQVTDYRKTVAPKAHGAREMLTNGW